MLDWGIGLAVGVGAAIVSEVALMTAIIMPKFPIEKGRTWRGTFYGVTTVSAVIGGIAGYIATQFGGFGGGGATQQGNQAAQATRAERPVVPSQPTRMDTAPQKPETYVASYIDLHFLRDEKTKLVTDFACELALYRLRDKAWKLEAHQTSAKNLDEFLDKVTQLLEGFAKEMAPDERAKRRLRVYMNPFPGEGAYDKIKQAAEARGWKVDRKDAAWQAEIPAS